MSEPISLKDAEERAFRTTHDDGLWDLLLGCFFLIFVVAPFLSIRLGDFWSSAVFLPFWALAWFGVRALRRHVVEPRVGVVELGAPRRRRLKRLSTAMLIVNLVALIGGVAAAASFGAVPGRVYSIFVGLAFLLLFSLAAHHLGIGRLYLYGLLAGLAPLGGEWLWSRGLASHHGFPVAFGVTAAVMFAVGAGLFARLLRDNPVPEGIAGGSA